eukprot:TRINITY_DN11257_c0_g4_i1.p1 TRINITY_DN11257_c0_g4~~TRINITY_DN11257_c0_g4_i1.p1  ORF type:complete len:235 (+),score=-20.24 TRINITY_DN11257_c0_g4_i1:169-873(+)
MQEILQRIINEQLLIPKYQVDINTILSQDLMKYYCVVQARLQLIKYFTDRVIHHSNIVVVTKIKNLSLILFFTFYSISPNRLHGILIYIRNVKLFDNEKVNTIFTILQNNNNILLIFQAVNYHQLFSFPQIILQNKYSSQNRNPQGAHTMLLKVYRSKLSNNANFYTIIIKTLDKYQKCTLQIQSPNFTNQIQRYNTKLDLIFDCKNQTSASTQIYHVTYHKNYSYESIQTRQI